VAKDVKVVFQFLEKQDSVYALVIKASFSLHYVEVADQIPASNCLKGDNHLQP